MTDTSEPIRIEREIKIARANIERDIAHIAEAVDRESSNKAFALTAAAAAIGLIVGFGGAKAIKVMLLLGVAGATAAVLARK
ncbi:MAG TPA: hypothetical protein VL284_04475 [Thermoanaerobaculia bacterium]|nr:hypothetical protein [Thermoanaerobaculia bacterium]